MDAPSSVSVTARTRKMPSPAGAVIQSKLAFPRIVPLSRCPTVDASSTRCSSWITPAPFPTTVGAVGMESTVQRGRSRRSATPDPAAGSTSQRGLKPAVCRRARGAPGADGSGPGDVTQRKGPRWAPTKLQLRLTVSRCTCSTSRSRSTWRIRPAVPVRPLTPHPCRTGQRPPTPGCSVPGSAAPVEFQVLACPGRWLVPTPPAVLAAVRSRVTRGPVAFALVEFSGVRRSASTHR